MAEEDWHGETRQGAHRACASSLLWILGILLATLAFWKLRIFDASKPLQIGWGNVDSFVYYYPMTRWGFEQLSSGALPHWNPFQLTGLPFLAIPYVGLLYPGNLIYAVMETAAATELSFILHLFFAGASTFALCRTLALSGPAGLAAAFTVMWSGWMTSLANHAPLISGMSWLPATVLMVELTIRGRRFAPFGLAVAVALQFLNGATEFAVQNLYVAGGYTLFRLAERIFAGQRTASLRQAFVLLGSVTCGVLLATPQLLPSIELVGQSVRGVAELSLAEARAMGAIGSTRFLLDGLMTRGVVNVGILPLAGIFLGATTRRHALWGFALVFVVLAALLVFGGEVFRLYHETPVGAMFRRPNKFLHVYAFGQAIMAALAVFALEAASSESRASLLRRPAFVATVLALSAGAFYVHRSGGTPGALLAMLGALVAFIAVESRKVRFGLVAALLVLQGAILFAGLEQRGVRPAASLEAFHRRDAYLDRLAERAGQQRVYIAGHLFWKPQLMQKQGMLHGIRMLGDYEPLASQRTAEFFRAVTPLRKPALHRFSGEIMVRPESDWGLLDLTGTRFYILPPTSPAWAHLDALARQGPRSGVGVIPEKPRIYERTSALPRAYFVPRARAVDSAEDALSVLRSEAFAPRREVVIEGASRSVAEHGDAAARGFARIVQEDNERVAIDVRAQGPGFLVLTDAYHPGWEANGPDGSLPLVRANYLFRAVPVPAGETRVEMRYVPRPFQRGLLVASATALLLATLALRLRRRPSTGHG